MDLFEIDADRGGLVGEGNSGLEVDLGGGGEASEGASGAEKGDGGGGELVAAPGVGDGETPVADGDRVGLGDRGRGHQGDRAGNAYTQSSRYRCIEYRCFE